MGENPSNKSNKITKITIGNNLINGCIVTNPNMCIQQKQIIIFYTFADLHL
jgi:hypothetical protein